ncbi:MAG TPA: hypothetical protein VMA95_05890 [Streptosporangiaceae bacterium]|nr:hypothetical protein [Streptosporangiaceae bacterium]
MKLGKTAARGLTAALCLALVACSGSQPRTSVHTVKKPAGQPTAGAAGEAVVKSTWVEFLNGAVPIGKRLKLLQNGQAFASFVHAQEKTSVGALVFQASGTVSDVVLEPSFGQAAVTYTILLGGKPLEKNLQGTATYSKGKWLVSDGTFCGLLKLVYKPKQIPAACGA